MSNRLFKGLLPLLVILVSCLFQVSLCETLNVHLVVNSHMDLGWVNTINEYYHGTSTRYGENVARMLTNIVDTLWANPRRTYCMAELAFLDLWLKEQTPETKNKVKTLLQEGRLELVNGGWVGNDEATAMYDDIIENFIVGHRWANEELQYKNISVGWQMDSFGTSLTQAYLLKEAGYNGVFFSRISGDERKQRKDNQALEFDWEFPVDKSSILTHAMSREYYKPPLRRAAWISMLGSMNENDYKDLNRTIWEERQFFKTNELLLLFCGDFWMSGGSSGIYAGFDGLVKFFSDHPEYNIVVSYSNPGKFARDLKTALESTSTQLPIKQGDFFPLNDNSGTIWTGFFTSKSNFKALVRWHSRYLTAVKLILSQRALQHFDTTDSGAEDELRQLITDLEKAVSIVQHHDAVSGTMKERVRFDYEDILSKARKPLENKLSELLLSDLLATQPKRAAVQALNNTYDALLGGPASPEIQSSINNQDSSSNLLLSVFNPGNTQLFLLTTNVSYALVRDTFITIETSDGRTIFPDIICKDDQDCSIYFSDIIQAYSWMYYQTKSSDEAPYSQGKIQAGQELIGKPASTGVRVENSNWAFRLDGGNTFSIIKTEGQTTTEKQFRLSYSYYESARHVRGRNDGSGAYLFNPDSVEKKSFSTENTTTVYIGDHVAIVQIQTPNFTTSLQFLLKQEQTGFSVITELEPLHNPSNGAEIVMEIDVPSIQTQGKFFTDANGYFMVERPYVAAATGETPQDEISKNYHPMTTRCSLEASNGQEAFTIFTDRAQGVAAVSGSNQINILLHRVTVTDDDKGVEEVLNEKFRGTSKPVRVTTWHHFLWSNNLNDQSQAEREHTQYNTERPLRFWVYSVNPAFSLASANKSPKHPANLPKSLKLSTRTYTENTHSIRLQNLDPKNSLSVALLDVSSDSPSSVITYLAQERLAPLRSVTETLWTTASKADSSQYNINENIMITIPPLQMRTFEISWGVSESG